VAGPSGRLGGVTAAGPWLKASMESGGLTVAANHGGADCGGTQDELWSQRAHAIPRAPSSTCSP